MKFMVTFRHEEVFDADSPQDAVAQFLASMKEARALNMSVRKVISVQKPSEIEEVIQAVGPLLGLR